MIPLPLTLGLFGVVGGLVHWLASSGEEAPFGRHVQEVGDTAIFGMSPMAQRIKSVASAHNLKATIDRRGIDSAVIHWSGNIRPRPQAWGSETESPPLWLSWYEVWERQPHRGNRMIPLAATKTKDAALTVYNQRRSS